MGGRRDTAEGLSDVSSGVDRASSAPASRRAISEGQLFHGYGADVEERPCQCGQPVTADPRCPMPEVAEHNNGAAHQAWRGSRE